MMLSLNVLALGSWLLAFGFWLLASGSWLLAASAISFAHFSCCRSFRLFRSSLAQALACTRESQKPRANYQELPSHHLRSPQIMQVNNSLHRAVRIRHHQRRNLSLLHDVQRAGGEFARGNRFGPGRHAVAGREVEHVFVLLQQPAQIAVTDHAQ